MDIRGALGAGRWSILAPVPLGRVVHWSAALGTAPIVSVVVCHAYNLVKRSLAHVARKSTPINSHLAFPPSAPHSAFGTFRAETCTRRSRGRRRGRPNFDDKGAVGGSTCHTWPSSQTSCHATRCTPPSPAGRRRARLSGRPVCGVARAGVIGVSGGLCRGAEVVRDAV